MSDVNLKENNNIVAKSKNLWLKYKEKHYKIEYVTAYLIISIGAAALQ